MNDESVFYKPLARGHFRVLQPDIRSSGKLSFTLVYLELKRAPTYSALSYVWGSQDLSHEIYLNGHPFTITRNLHDALSQLHTGVHAGDWTVTPLSKLIWVDAICINQATSTTALKERSVQVEMMAEVYLRAAYVYVWLGLPLNIVHNHLAEQKMRDCETNTWKQHAKALGGHRPWRCPHKPLDAMELAERVKLDIATSENKVWIKQSTARDTWAAVSQWWSVAWWTRAWAFQEGSVPEATTSYYIKGMTPKPHKAKVRFVYGDRWSTWSRIICALSISTSMIAINPAIRESVNISKLLGVLRLSDIRIRRSAAKSSGNSNDAFDTLYALNSLRLGDCFDCRDKIYAARALITVREERALIVPDYQKSPRQIYIELSSRLLLSREPGLNVLGHTCPVHNVSPVLLHRRMVANGQTKEERLPSWVPNWNVRLDIMPLPKLLYHQRPLRTYRATLFFDNRGGSKMTTTTITRAYNACGEYQTSDAQIADGTMHTSAVFFDTVRETIRFSLAANEISTRLSTWKRRLATTTYPNGSTFDAHIWRVKWADVWFVEGQNSVTVAVARMTHQDVGKAAVEARPAVTKQRCYGLTGRDRLALVPYTSAPGDLICMLYGGQVLYVLRPKPGTDCSFEYVGEAYVHGMMDGAVAEMVAKRQAVVQKIVIE